MSLGLAEALMAAHGDRQDEGYSPPVQASQVSVREPGTLLLFSGRSQSNGREDKQKMVRHMKEISEWYELWERRYRKVEAES